MAEDSISVDQAQFNCPVCLDLLEDPVNITCGHSFCMNQLKEKQTESQQRIQEKEKKLQELKQAVNTLKISAQTAVEDSERIFTELISSIEKKRSEVTEVIRTQEETELRAAEELMKQLEQEISDLKRRHTDLEELSHTEDHVHFLQSFQSLQVSSGSEHSPNIGVLQHLSFDEVIRSVSDLKKQLEELCEEKFSTMSPHAAEVQNFPSKPKTRKHVLKPPAVQILLPEPKTREDFLQYFCQLTLDPNTASPQLSLSEDNKVVTGSHKVQQYPDHPERFDWWYQVLSKESVSGRSYWEVEWSSVEYVYITVAYKDISRKGGHADCKFGGNGQSWSLLTSSPLSFWHNNTENVLSSPPSSRIGVYVDHSAGTLSFYSVSDTMTLLHTVHTTFTQPLHAGFWFPFVESTVRLCHPK